MIKKKIVYYYYVIDDLVHYTYLSLWRDHAAYEPF